MYPGTLVSKAVYEEGRVKIMTEDGKEVYMHICGGGIACVRQGSWPALFVGACSSSPHTEEMYVCNHTCMFAWNGVMHTVNPKDRYKAKCVTIASMIF